LTVTVEGRLVLKDVGMEIVEGETVALMGANGSGKSSLAMALLGDVRYKILDSSEVRFEGQDLLKMSTDERTRAGLYVAWQNPVSIPGVSVFNLCRASYSAMGHKIDKLTDFRHKIEELAIKVGLTKQHIERSVGEGFSGGEKKRLELLQLLLLNPKLVILDEIDSGLDSKGVEIVVEIVGTMKKRGTSFILITHNKRLLEEIVIDKTWEMKHGQLQTRV